jgi:hypothetical protein
MGIGEGGLGNEGASAEEVPGGGNIVAGLIPKVGKTEEGDMGEIDGSEEQRVEHPGGDVGCAAAIADG